MYYKYTFEQNPPRLGTESTRLIRWIWVTRNCFEPNPLEFGWAMSNWHSSALKWMR